MARRVSLLPPSAMNLATVKKFAVLTAGVLLAIYVLRQVPMVGPYADKALNG